MTDDAHILPLRPAVPAPGGPGRDVSAHAGPGRRRGPWYARVLPAAGRGARRSGRWLATWARRLVSIPFLWVGIVLGFGTSLLVWESVLLLGVVTWLAGVWLWTTRRSPVLVALGLGLVLGWLPMLFFIVGSLPHTMIGPPGVEYDL